MAEHERSRGAACYHVLIAIILLLLGGGFLGFGIWLRVGNHTGAPQLNFSGSSVLTLLLHISIIAIIAGCVFIVTSIISLLALARRFVGKVFRVIYVLLALVILAALIFIAVVAFWIYVNRDMPVTRDVLNEGWKTGVREDPRIICGFEKDFKCRGFLDNKCDPEKCARCEGTTGPIQGRDEACYPKIKRSLRNVYLPVGIVSTIMAVLVLTDVFVTCAL